ncbi:prohead protease/major capsid protein fusion protein [Agrobacterium vitis]|uniref:prohead protease/major capsid protein fusion protein n=1 Tax=Agrobacterium vitis TaxID=373 RepID=UPI0015717101|nr:prohead protease/major capsid protein fusion protein [Agrobacterium vitis]NSZ17557.1 peptidase [Agrobacterium vitis]QZO03251.1 HK97 family phage prohead protease [Agrobacterium vitis]UJL88371.1 HK97 family phage prohead protease [Agrobacterium vitis]
MPKTSNHRIGRKPPVWQRHEKDDVRIDPSAVRGPLPVTLTRAATVAGQFDEAAMTITAVISTATPVARRDVKGVYGEILDPNGVRSENEVPLLDAHAQGSIRSVIGIAKNIRVENGEVVADLRFSLADDVQPIVQRVKDGTVSRFSVGYRPLTIEDSRSGSNRIRTLTEWMLTEVSLVPLGADPNARRRAANMPEEITLAPDVEQQQIRSLAELAGLSRGWAEDQIDAGATLETARAEALAQMQGRSQQTRVRVVAANDAPEQIVRRQTDALAFRAAGGELPEDARQFVEMSFRDIAISSLERAGVSVRGLTTDEILTRAASMTTSDFPLIVSNVANKIALERFNAAASALTPLVRKRTLPNFKTSTAIRAGELGELKPLAEDGEIQHTARTENGETLSLATFAAGLNVSRKLLIDDDANLLGDMTAALADAAANTVSNKLAGLLIDTHKLSDNKDVFHVSRGNLATGDSGVLDLRVSALADARKSMRVVKGLDGKTIVGAAPKYLVVGPEMETYAEMVLAEIYASDIANGNPFAQKFTLLVEPRISDKRWFLFADPSRLPVLQMAYLSSAQGVQIQRTEAWDTLGMRFRAFLDFGCGWSDWRGAYKNPGE